VGSDGFFMVPNQCQRPMGSTGLVLVHRNHRPAAGDGKLAEAGNEAAEASEKLKELETGARI